MKNIKRRKPYILWKSAESKADRFDRLQKFIWNWLTVTIVLFTTCSMLSDIIPEVTVSVGTFLLTELELIILMLLAEFGIPEAEKSLRRYYDRKHTGADSSESGRNLRSRKAAVIKWVSGILALCLIALLFRKYYLYNQNEIEKGIRCILHPYMEDFNKIYKTGIYYKEGRYGYANLAIGFWMMCILTFVYIIAKLLRKMWFILIMPAAAFVAGMLINVSPNWISLIFFAVSLYMLNTSAVGKNITGITMTAKGRKSGTLHRYMTLVVCILVLVLVGLSAEGLSESLISKNKEFIRFQKKLEAALGSFWSSNSKTVDNQSPQYSDKTVITIETSGPVGGNLYLKTFYGEEYDDGSWRTRSNSFTGACKEADINASEIQDMLMNHAYDMCSSNNMLTYTFDYGSFSGKSFPIPYISNIGAVDGVSMEGDVLLKKGMFRSSVTLEAANNNTAAIYEHLTSQLRYSEQTDDEALWAWYNNYVMTAYGIGASTVPSASKTANRIMLTVPDCSSILQYGTAYQKADMRLRLASEVSDYLAETCVYSWDLDELPDDTDVIEYFLTEGHAGYCMHFASAGVLLLRKMGIPARYASGYIVKQEAFEKQSDGTYLCEVKDRNAHAWVEIYLDNIGWVPVEMTPGYSGSSATLPTDKDQEAARQQAAATPTPTSLPDDILTPDEPQPTETPTPTNTPTPTALPDGTTPTAGASTPGTTLSPEGTPGKDGTGNNTSPDGQNGGTTASDSGSVIGTLIKTVLIVLCSAAVCVGLVLIIKKLVTAYNEYIYGEFRRRRYRTAVKRMNRRLYKKLRHTGKIRRKDITDEEYEDLLVQLYPEITACDWHLYMEIVKKAAYSREEIAREEADLVLGHYQRIRKAKKKG